MKMFVKVCPPNQLEAIIILASADRPAWLKLFLIYVIAYFVNK